MSIVLHHSHAQLQAAAIRDAYRNPPRPQVDAPASEPTPKPKHRLLAHLLARAAQPLHRSVAAPAA